MGDKIKMSESDFIELVAMMEQQEFCVMSEIPMCGGNCANCLSKKLLEIIDCGY